MVFATFEVDMLPSTSEITWRIKNNIDFWQGSKKAKARKQLVGGRMLGIHGSQAPSTCTCSWSWPWGVNFTPRALGYFHREQGS